MFGFEKELLICRRPLKNFAGIKRDLCSEPLDKGVALREVDSCKHTQRPKAVGAALEH